MKTTKRSKMLLSSIAMLLVALVALGSATYAWYITQNSVTAETSQFSATSAQGLVIRHTTSDEWTNSIDDLEAADTLAPATCNYNSAIAGLVRAGGGTGTAFDDGTLTNTLTEETTALTNGKIGSFLYDSFYVASSSASSVTATLTLTAATVTGTYMNFLVYVGGTLKGVYTSDEDASTTSKVSSSTGQTVTTTTGQSLTALNNNVVDANITCPSKSGEGVKIEIVAFADGFNSKCKSSSANTSNVTVEYSVATNS